MNNQYYGCSNESKIYGYNGCGCGQIEMYLDQRRYQPAGPPAPPRGCDCNLDDLNSFRVIQQGAEHYPCNGACQIKGGLSECEIVDVENRLLRTDRIYTKNKNIDIWGVLM